MLRNLEYLPCIPTRGAKVQVKHDGYRLIVQREGKRVRLLTRRGYDWSDRYPLVTQAALRLRKSSFVIDRDAVVLGPGGIAFVRFPTHQPFLLPRGVDFFVMSPQY
jgi:bifunctional non-homologous end joining protein LigD